MEFPKMLYKAETQVVRYVIADSAEEEKLLEGEGYGALTDALTDEKTHGVQFASAPKQQLLEQAKAKKTPKPSSGGGHVSPTATRAMHMREHGAGASSNERPTR
jgi:hypothetical protein